jgi:chromosome condensin MukBEF ATPase and DNA-binding subunit MukB
MTFKLSKQQVTERDALAGALRQKAEQLNTAIDAFNHALAPLTLTVRQALDDYNGTLEEARTLASSVTGGAQAKFDAKSQKWQESDKGIEVRVWIEQWEVALDDIDLDLPEPLAAIDPDEQAGAIVAAPVNPATD